MSRLILLLVLASGCLDSFELQPPVSGDVMAGDDGGVDVGDEPDLAGAFGPEDAAPVAQLDLGQVSTRHHPLGFAASTLHGAALKAQKEDCRLCHGTDLAGGSAPVSCDSCHKAGWRTDCSYCHGGPGGLPPRDLNGETDPTKISFPAHGKHAAGNISAPFGCPQCHRPNLDVLSNLHLFDDTPGRAEVLMAGGLSPASTFDPATKSCANNYCHGNGRAPGTIAFDAPPRTCSSCHADITTPNLWNTMSGDHARHLREGDINCTHCHSGTVAQNPSVISDKTRHLDGKRNIQFGGDAAGVTYDVTTRRCTGSCHGENHNDTW